MVGNKSVDSGVVRPPVLVATGDLGTFRRVTELAGHRFEFRVARDARRAMEILSETPRLLAVLVQNNLPDSEGVGLLEQVSAAHPDVRRILLANPTDLAPVIQGLHSGAIQRLVHIPFGPNELLSALTVPVEARAASQRTPGALVTETPRLAPRV
ncbi:MAG: hypothetical protein ACREIT_05215 [Tepidisphaeraceae bacterium]